jgi:lipoprotein-anchoring transpeptidase ErfK/SrfK
MLIVGMSRLRVCTSVLAVAACAMATTSIAAAAGTSTAGAAPPDIVLSNETTSSTWSVADYAVPIRTGPSNSASRIARLQFQTPDGFLQSYILLRQHSAHGTPWIQLRIPGRPNGRIGWVPRSALDAFTHTNMELVVNRAARRLTLYRGGRVVFTAPVGVGKPNTPTPPGHFWITEAFPSHNAAYGPFAFGTSDYSTLSDWVGGGIVGLHGTNEPSLVPGDPSHGCIRLHNSDVLRLSHMLSIGTPLLVQ